MAWKVLLEIRDCQKGLIEIPLWGKLWQPEECGSFHDRYTLVRNALHHSKAAVASLFDHSFSKRLTLAPTVEITKIRANRVVNRKRKGDLDLAAEEKKKRGIYPAARRGRKELFRGFNQQQPPAFDPGHLQALPHDNDSNNLTGFKPVQVQFQTHPTQMPQGEGYGPMYVSDYRVPSSGQYGLSGATSNSHQSGIYQQQQNPHPESDKKDLDWPNNVP